MSLDRTTEIISHFIGAFHLGDMEARMRDQYQEFKAEEKAEEDPEMQDLTAVKIKSPYRLKDYDPELKYKPQAIQTPSAPVPLPEAGYVAEALTPAVVFPESDLPGDPPALSADPGRLGFEYLPYVPIPSSVIGVTFQFNFLFDNDVVGDPFAAGFVAIEHLHAALETLASIGAAVGYYVVSPLLDELQADHDFAMKVLEAIDSVEATGLDGVDTWILSFEDLFGTETVDETEVAKADSLGDLATPGEDLTGQSADREGASEDAGPLEGEEIGSGHEGSDLGDTDDDPFSDEVVAEAPLPDGVSKAVVVNGELLEEAPDLEAQLPQYVQEKQAEDEEDDDEQLNPLADKHEPDTPNPYEVDPGHQVVAGANQVVNTVSLATSWIDADVIAVEGDVISATVVSQTNVISDKDNLDGTVSSAESNALNLAEFYSEPSDSSEPEPVVDDPVLPAYWNVETYDGDVIALNQYTQHNFVSDHDMVSFSITAEATFLGTGENLVFNNAHGGQLGFGYDLILVGGHMIDLTLIEQTNVLLDDDSVSLAPGVDADVSGDDNLLLNHASITEYSVDQYEEMQENFADALEDLAEGLEDLTEDLTQDGLFAGLEALSVLYISGDLMSITSISQTSIVGDADQVALALEDFVEDHEDEIEVITGSNVLINEAFIQDFGLDSVVMAGGEVYDDALLYQAELIDTDADPLGVQISELANEAVAFLADDMLIPELPEGHDIYGDPAAGEFEGAPTADVMQTMTA